MTEQVFAYIGREKCGCVTCTVVDSPEFRKDTARYVARWLREGMDVERVSVEEARQLIKFCRCNEVKA